MQTTVTKRNMHQLDRIAALAEDTGCRMWSLFFLIVTGRALAADDLTAEDLVCRLLVRRGIYARACDDKKGLEPGKFIRVASRTRSENRYVLRGFKEALRS